MTVTDNNKWKTLLLAGCCIIIISVVGLFIISPGNRIELGTCGPDSVPMNYSTEIQPAFELSYLHEFGEQEPVRNVTLPRILLYPEKQQIIDTLMTRAQLTGLNDSVIGLYEFPDARLLLIDQNSQITEVLETGDNIQSFNLTPVLVGDRHYKINETANLSRNAYNFSYENSVAISRIDLVLPPPGNMTIPVYIVNKTYFEQDFYPDGRSLASLTTTGRFFVIYGQRVERVTGTSAIILDPAWKPCSPRTEIAGEGSATGEIKFTVKLARSSERLLWTHLITTSDQIQNTDVTDTSSSQWKSVDSTGCSC